MNVNIYDMECHTEESHGYVKRCDQTKRSKVKMSQENVCLDFNWTQMFPLTRRSVVHKVWSNLKVRGQYYVWLGFSFGMG